MRLSKHGYYAGLLAYFLANLVLIDFVNMVTTSGARFSVMLVKLLASLILGGMTLKHLVDHSTGSIISARTAESADLPQLIGFPVSDYVFHCLVGAYLLLHGYWMLTIRAQVRGDVAQYVLLWILADIVLLVMTGLQLAHKATGKDVRVVRRHAGRGRTAPPEPPPPPPPRQNPRRHASSPEPGTSTLP